MQAAAGAEGRADVGTTARVATGADAEPEVGAEVGSEARSEAAGAASAFIDGSGDVLDIDVEDTQTETSSFAEVTADTLAAALSDVLQETASM